MIIISSGFPKSASTLLYLYTESLINSSGKSGGQKLFRRFNREGFTPHFGFLNTLWYVFASMFGPLVVKTHAGPTFFIRLLISVGLATAFYSVRDPRDAVLSAMDHGRKAREKGIQTDSDIAFAPFEKWEDVYPAFHMHHRRYEAWKEYDRVLFVRYEEVIQHPDAVLQKIVRHVRLPKLVKNIPDAVYSFAQSKRSTRNFNKGELVRFTTELKSDEIAKLEKEMGACITSMGYTLVSQT